MLFKILDNNVDIIIPYIWNSLTKIKDKIMPINAINKFMFLNSLLFLLMSIPGKKMYILEINIVAIKYGMYSLDSTYAIPDKYITIIFEKYIDIKRNDMNKYMENLNALIIKFLVL